MNEDDLTQFSVDYGVRMNDPRAKGYWYAASQSMDHITDAYTYQATQAKLVAEQIAASNAAFENTAYEKKEQQAQSKYPEHHDWGDIIEWNAEQECCELPYHLSPGDLVWALLSDEIEWDTDQAACDRADVWNWSVMGSWTVQAYRLLSDHPYYEGKMSRVEEQLRDNPLFGSF